MGDDVVEQTVMYSLGGIVAAGVVVAGCTAGCLACCYYSKSYRDLWGKVIKGTKKDKDDYKQLQEDLPMSGNGGEGSQPEDIEMGAIPKPRKSVDKSKAKKKPKEEDEMTEENEFVDVEKGKRDRAMKRMISVDKSEKDAGKDD